jgi:hypothetical protein
VKLKTIALLAASHAIVLGIGFAAGVYVLPILTAPQSPSEQEAAAAAKGARYYVRFHKELKGSDFLHWAEGKVAIGKERVAFTGQLAPGPDYKLYFSPEYVDTREGFLRVKARAARAGDIRTFDAFVVSVPPTIDIGAYDTVVVWCERFSMFITSAKYR